VNDIEQRAAHLNRFSLSGLMTTARLGAVGSPRRGVVVIGQLVVSDLMGSCWVAGWLVGWLTGSAVETEGQVPRQNGAVQRNTPQKEGSGRGLRMSRR